MPGTHCGRSNRANLESVRTCESTHDIHALIIGEHITGTAAFWGSRRRSLRLIEFFAPGTECRRLHKERRWDSLLRRSGHPSWRWSQLNRCHCSLLGSIGRRRRSPRCPRR